MLAFCKVVGTTNLFATLLLTVHAIAWALLYLALGALPDAPSAILYSLSALTSHGHAELFLEKRWQLMGALEAVNGVLLFGLTTAFPFAVIQAVWPFDHRCECPHLHAQARIFTALAATRATVSRDTIASAIMSTFARAVSGIVSVGEKAVALVNDRNR